MEDSMDQYQADKDDQEQILNDFIDRNDITFEIRAIYGDGEVLARATSKVSADDLVCYAESIDEQVLNTAMEQNL